ncbi:hypothetical protein CIB84_009016 [Bambusicola thoracicus]|uniref:Isochorismatase domain-containing protein 1 n=1 Tax=Bambusicola thoracicus TaxID=9083 RepID=A0A2P4ST04_BAMTH|nr:hypothetical protein CIB84_009016 [Bambusicola thoracicus]
MKAERLCKNRELGLVITEPAGEGDFASTETKTHAAQTGLEDPADQVYCLTELLRLYRLPTRLTILNTSLSALPIPQCFGQGMQQHSQNCLIQATEAQAGGDEALHLRGCTHPSSQDLLQFMMQPGQQELENSWMLAEEICMTTLGNLTPSSTVFFCCDMQERFRPAIKYFGDIISVGQRLLQGARLLGIPVIVTEQYPKGLGSTVQEIDLTGAKLVLPKTKFSMVLPEVEAALAEIPGVRSVVLFGVETHVCIQQTALELIGRGLEVHIVADATSSRSMMDRMFALERLARTGIIVTTSEAILLQLVADKEHPKFKEVQNLIKASAPESGLLSKV